MVAAPTAGRRTLTRRPGPLLPLLVGALLGALFGGCSALPDPPAPLVRDVAYGDVTALDARPADAELRYGDDPLHFALGWEANEPRGLVVLVHGGCWLNAFDLEHTRPLAVEIAARGWETWSVEYRRTGDPGGGWPGSLDDVEAAARAIAKARSARPLVLAGHSAGGHLALLAAGRMGDEASAAIGLAAITDVATYARGSNSCQQATPGFMGGTPDARPRAYTAAAIAAPPVPRTVLLAGSADVIVPLEQSSVPGVVRKTIDGAGHFDFVHPGSEAVQVFLETLADVTAGSR